MELQIIQSKIFEIRGCRVMLDFDLAELYETETKILKQAVRRNIERFPSPDFMFVLTQEEYISLRSQNVTLERGKGRHSKYSAFAFTEHGTIMIASILKNSKAIQVNISIVRAFVTLRQLASEFTELNQKLETFMLETNMQFNDIYQALTELASKEEEQKDFDKRSRIGFKVNQTNDTKS
jgi:hypothetical protein